VTGPGCVCSMRAGWRRSRREAPTKRPCVDEACRPRRAGLPATGSVDEAGRPRRAGLPATGCVDEACRPRRADPADRAAPVQPTVPRGSRPSDRAGSARLSAPASARARRPPISRVLVRRSRAGPSACLRSFRLGGTIGGSTPREDGAPGRTNSAHRGARPPSGGIVPRWDYRPSWNYWPTEAACRLKVVLTAAARTAATAAATPPLHAWPCPGRTSPAWTSRSRSSEARA